MALKAILTAAEHGALDASIKALYKAEGDRFVIDAEGLEDHPAAVTLKRALERERKEKGDRDRELAELKAKVGDLDPDAARAALKRIKELEDGAILGEIPDKFKKQFEEAVEHRTKTMREDFENQKKAFNTNISNEKKTNETLTARIAELTIDNEVRKEAEKLGFHDWAIEDAVMHANKVYRVKDGKPVPFDGDQIIYGKNPNEPKPIAEWLTEKAQAKPGWMKESKGGGSNNGTGNNTGGVNQFKITRADARDRQKWLSVEEAAKKAGTIPQVVD